MICRRISGGRVGRLAGVFSGVGAGEGGRSEDGSAVGGSFRETNRLSGNKLRSFLDRGGMGSKYLLVFVCLVMVRQSMPVCPSLEITHDKAAKPAQI
jgi:hypothetical protein